MYIVQCIHVEVIAVGHLYVTLLLKKCVVNKMIAV